MNIFDTIRQSLTPGMAKLALKGLHSGLEKSTGNKIEVFNMVYIKSKNEIYFDVVNPDSTTKKWAYDDADTTIKMIEGYAATQLEKGDTIDVVILGFALHNNPQYLVKAYYTKADGKKLSIEHPIS